MIDVIYKEAAGEHALHGACTLHRLGQIIGAHILACAAAEVLGHVAEKEIGYSVYRSLWEAARELEKEYGKKLVDKISASYNYFKHADRDYGKEVHFDKKITDHILFMASVDLMRIGKAMPERDGYKVSVSDVVMNFFGLYIATYKKTAISLANLDGFVECKRFGRT
ncbi:MAG: hypothetical protein NVV74_15790 [Magnetospirillum sp.]|nr:hypothetical protein [Magnetospirillum sp.]